MTHQPPRVSFVGKGDSGLFRKHGRVAFRTGNGRECSPIRLVDRQITRLSVDPLQDLPDERGLARLAWPGDDDQPLGFLVQALEKRRFLCALIDIHSYMIHS